MFVVFASLFRIGCSCVSCEFLIRCTVCHLNGTFVVCCCCRVTFPLLSFLLCKVIKYQQGLECDFSSLFSASGEVHPGCQPRLCEGPVHHLPFERGGATGQQGPAGESTQIHAGALVVRSQVLAQRYKQAGSE